MAASGYKLFVTGDVLTAAQVNDYLMLQTVMVFANSTARTSALSGVLAEGLVSYLKDTDVVEVYTGAAWVSLDDPNAIQNSIVDAKGDLISATADNTPARLAVGNNGETLVADSSTATGLRYQGNFAAGKNKCINGDFSIWQRGTSFTTQNNVYTADRITGQNNGSATYAISRQTFTPGAAPVAGYEGQYFYRYQITAAGSGNTFNNFENRIEDVRTLAGQTVTASVWLKADTNRNVTLYLYQNFGSGGSGTVLGGTTTWAVTTSWTRFTYSFTMPSISGKTIGTSSFLQFNLDLPANTTFTIDAWGMQLEAGSVATAFQTATGTIQGELAACQRYYFRNTSVSGTSGFMWLGINANYVTSTRIDGFINYPVNMRRTPTSVDFSTVGWIRSWGGGVNTITNVTIQTDGTSPWGGILTFTTTSASSSNPELAYYILSNNSAGYVGLSAEL